MTANPRRVYIVLCQSWTYADGWYQGDDWPIKAFALLEQAEQYVARCQATELQRNNPGRQRETRFVIVPMMVTEENESPASGGCQPPVEQRTGG